MTPGNGWRWWLSVAGVGLGSLPLWQGTPLLAVVAAICGLTIVGGWAWGTRAGRATGVALGSGWIAALIITFAVSQWPHHLIGAPWLDWFVVWLLIGGVCLAALVIDRYVHALSAGHRIEQTPLAVHARWVASVAPLAGMVLLCGCGLGLVQADGDGSLRVAVRADEVLPLPASLRLVSADKCAGGGSSGNCTAEFVVTAADGAGRATTVTRLVEHLRGRGWPLEPRRGLYTGDRETGGILNWTPHHAWLYADAEPASILRSAPPPDAVVVYLDNL